LLEKLYDREGKVKTSSSIYFHASCLEKITFDVKRAFFSEEMLFKNLVAALATLHPRAVEDDPMRRYKLVGLGEGGMQFKNAIVNVGALQVLSNTSKMPSQNRIYPAIVALVINDLSHAYQKQTSGSVEERLLRAAMPAIQRSKYPSGLILEEVKRERQQDPWHSFFGNLYEQKSGA
jgi:hypothetical protein